ncbi:hypothetical protein BDN70DRAFT_475826 [Pholiota conissans]|uniref:Exonuclease domain-containing protein n=1 Tax=Pholiota conissans TaxID=109636 RepID=A0A9P6CSV9_9AGAR|nr:hypothetical protein BDN70DRAFT_475826 [Pholiota conissans]
MNLPSTRKDNEEISTSFGSTYTTSPGLLAFGQQTNSEEVRVSFPPEDTSWRSIYSPEKSFRYIGIGVVNVYIGTMKFRDKSEAIPMVARVSLIDYRGRLLFDSYIRPTHLVEDYRQAQTGLSYDHLCNAPSFVDVQKRIAAYIQDKIIVGHRVWIFLAVLGLSHPALHTRDLALFRPMRKKLGSRVVVELSTLVKVFMARDVGLQYEDSAEFSRAAMDLFRSCQEIFEDIITAGQWPCDLPPERFAEHYS